MREAIASFLLRMSLGAVFLLFGIGKFGGDYWARTMEAMPLIQRLPWPTRHSVWAAGVLETATAALLIFGRGRLLRCAGAAAAVQLAVILILVQFQETRDFALLGSALYIALRRDGK